MFADPQVVTVNAVAQSMPRISSTGLAAVYQKPDKSFKLTISHTDAKQRIRTMSRIDQRAVVADPLTSVNDYETLSIYLVSDRPEVGFTSAQVEQLITGFKTWLDSGVMAKLFGLES